MNDRTHLDVHVIGANVGESIVLHLPDGRIGVIDCYTNSLRASSPDDRLSANPTLRFIASELKADSLAFVAVTHPHEDHARGISQLLEHFDGRVDEVWMYSCWQDTYLLNFFRALTKLGVKLTTERLLEESVGTFYCELLKTRQILRKWLQRVEFREFRGCRRFSLCDGRVHVCFLGPNDNRVERYRSRLIDNVTDVVTENPITVQRDWEPLCINHNEISAAVRVQFGQTVLVLGGDMERAAWQDVMQDTSVGRNEIQSHYVKVAHHGSSNGYCDGLYEAHAIGGRKPVAVLTPKTASHLPSTEGIDHLLARTSSLFATNRVVLESYCEEIDERTAHQWAQLLMRRPEWASFAHSSLVDTELDRIAEPPSEFNTHLIKEPLLIPGLREDLRERIVKPPNVTAEKDCRVTFRFDDRGNELMAGRYIGSHAGKCERQA